MTAPFPRFGRCAPLLALALGGVALAAPPAGIGSLRLIGVRSIPPRTMFHDTVIGGLSGLDYEAASDTWIAESDDKSEFGPARCYTLRLDYDETKFNSAVITGVTFFRQRDGTAYPDLAQAATRGGEIPDFEAVRFDPRDGSVWYASEGDRPLGMSPFVRHAARDGTLLAELPLPAMFKVHPHEEAGPRHNLSFEGLAFSPDGGTLWLAMEAPLYQDGPRPTLGAGAVARLTHFDRAGKILGQFAYPVEPIPAPPAAGKLADNGVSEILAIGDRAFLVLERSGAQDAADVFHYHARLYEIEIGDATDVREIPALPAAAYRPVTKRRVLDFNRLGRPWVDNLEGLSWGRRLANGHRSLVLVSDDNFSARQETQFWVFEVMADSTRP